MLLSRWVDGVRNLRLGYVVYAHLRNWDSLFRCTTYVSLNFDIYLPGPPVQSLKSSRLVEGGEWRVESGGWRVEGGEWREADDLLVLAKQQKE